MNTMLTLLPPQMCVCFHFGLLLLALLWVRVVGCSGGRKGSVTSVMQIFLHAFCTKLKELYISI